MKDKYVTPVTKTRIELIKRLIDVSFDEIDHGYTSVNEDFWKLNDRYTELLGISDALKKENEALKAQLSRYEQGQPMETAPRDGRSILVVDKYGEFWVVVYYEGQWTDFDNELSENILSRWWPLPGNTPSETQRQEQENE